MALTLFTKEHRIFDTNLNLYTPEELLFSCAVHITQLRINHMDLSAKHRYRHQMITKTIMHLLHRKESHPKTGPNEHEKIKCINMLLELRTFKFKGT